MVKRLPDHARDFKGRAKNIPERDTFLLPYQTRWVQDRSLVRLMEKSRRIGISYATAYDEVRQHSQKGNKIDTWFSSRDDLTAREFIIYCQKFAGVLNLAAKSFDSEILFNDGKNVATASILRFATGQRINSVSSNPDVFAGKGGNVGLDEFAVRQDPRNVYDIASPTIDWGGRLSIISTHRGAGNFFNRLIQDEQSGDPRKMRGISLHKVTLTKALEEGFLWKLQTVLPESDPRMEMDEGDYYDYQRSRMSSEERFLQEYECEPEDEASVFLPYDLLQGSFYPAAEDLVEHTETTKDFRGKKGRIRYLLPRGVKPSGMTEYLKSLDALYHGKDVARKQDLSVDIFGEKKDGLLLTRAVVEFDRVAFSRQEAVLYPVMPKVARSCVDSTGIGEQFAERCAEKFGDWRVEAINFTLATKEMLAGPVRTLFEDRAARIPEDERFIGDLRMIEKETIGDRVRYVATDDDDEADSHADRFWAFALMNHAAKQKVSNFTPTAFNRIRNAFSTGGRNRKVAG